MREANPQDDVQCEQRRHARPTALDPLVPMPERTWGLELPLLLCTLCLTTRLQRTLSADRIFMLDEVVSVENRHFGGTEWCREVHAGFLACPLLCLLLLQACVPAMAGPQR